MLFENEPTLTRDVAGKTLVEDLRRRISGLASDSAVSANTRVAAWEVRAGRDSALYSDVHTFA